MLQSEAMASVSWFENTSKFSYSFLSLISESYFLPLFASSAIYIWFPNIVYVNILRSSSYNNFLSTIAIFVRNFGKRMVLAVTQLWSFFKNSKFPTAAQSSTSVIGKQLLFLALAQSCLESRKTTGSYPGGPVREFFMIVFLRDLFPTDA